MEFQSPIVAGSEIAPTRIGAAWRKSVLEKSSLSHTMMDFPSPNRHSVSIMSDDLSQTVFDSDPTFTRIGTLKKTFDETRFDTTMNLTRRPKEELMSVLLEEDIPGIEDALQLFESFLKVFQTYKAENQVFNQLAEYESKCTEQVDSLRRLIQIAPQGHGKLTFAVELEKELRLERDTWRLVASLYQDRLNCDLQDSEMEELWVTLDNTTSEEDLVKQLYEKNAIIRQAQLVVDWLEQRAADVYHDSHYNQAEFFGDAIAGWENTLHSLHSLRQGRDMEEQNFITEMDPDAPIRQQHRHLHPLDKEDDLRLLKSVFSRLRCGQLDEAQQLCFRAGQPYRAALLEGWKLFHDPNMKSSSSTVNIKNPSNGNPYRDIWKAMTWNECENENLSAEERAILGLLCGNLKTLLPSCPSWDDQLWAYLRSMIDRNVEKELRRCVNYNRQLEILSDEYWSQQFTVDTIFSSLAASRDKSIVNQGRDPYRIIQRYIIMDDVDGLLEEMSSWLTKGEESLNWSVYLRPHMLRLMAHLALFLRRIGRASCDELIVPILEAYVQQLVHLSRTDLAPVYVSQLPLPEDQIALYAQCLVLVDRQSESCDLAERQRYLALAQEVGLDVKAVAKRVVATLCRQEAANFVDDVSLQVATSAEDERRISSLGWLLIDPSMRSELLAEANTLMRGFLLRRQIEAVKSTFQLVPIDTISLISEQWEARTGLNELPPELQSSIREYVCIKTYLDALDAFNEWFTRFHHSKPKRTTVQQTQQQRSGSQISFTENLLKEQQNKQHQAEMHRWKLAIESLTQSAVDKLYNVLLFPDGGWMVDTASQGQDDFDSRANEMQLLRQTCVPHAALLLSSVLSSTKQYTKSLELINVIAVEPQALYKVCSAEQLTQLMKNIRQAYVKVLDMGGNP